ncbi:MAG TPA: rRNA maturation RNase YbeY [Bryobacteraceae bacterium]|jgi:probable rRNA maturation factor|nr:rRNA maturation RNase YbeY [Bryobacteraceae bacterium]
MSVDGSTVLFGATPRHLEFSPEDKRALRRFARELERRAAGGRAFHCLMTTDREMQRLNRDFLGHDYATDVLSFPNANGHGGLGDIAVSSERAQAQAEEFGHEYLDEIRILMLHGVLHLTGMDHERDGGEMERAEERWRNEFGLPATLIARVAGGGRGE